MPEVIHARFDGGRLRQERKRLGLSQKEAGDELGVSRGSVIHYELNDGAPDANALIRAHDAGMDAWFLLTGIRHETAAGDFIDMELLRAMIRAVDEFSQRRKLDLPQAKKDTLVRVLYGQFSRLGIQDQKAAAQLLEGIAA